MSKVTFESLWFKNFMSFGNVKTVVDLTETGTTLIIGENMDEGGSSGAGKTTLMNALSYVLYDKIPRDDVKKDKLINNVNASKTVAMEAGVIVKIGADKYAIERRRGQQAGVSLLKNDVDITPDSVANFNLAIEELIGFSYNLFSQIILFNGNSTAFLSLSGPQQRELIEELLRITILSRKAEALKLKMNAIEAELKLQLALIEQQKRHAERHQGLIAAARKRVTDWQGQHEVEIVQQERKLEALLAIDFEAEEQLHVLIKELQDKIAPIDAQLGSLEREIRAERAKISPYGSKLAVLKRDLSANTADRAKTEGDLLHLRDAKCPYCLQKYESAEVKIAEVTARFEALTKRQLELVEDLRLEAEQDAIWETSRDSAAGNMQLDVDELKASKVGFATELSELQTALTYKTYKDHIAAANMAGTLAEKIDRLRVEANPHVDALTALENDPGVVIDTTQIDELSKLKEHQKILHKLLTDKNSYIRKGIIGKTLPFLNKRIAYYTERLGLPHVVLFQPDMSCEITKLGIELGHGNLSNGEQKRLNLGLCFAFRDALTYLHSKVNLLLTDEVDGGSLDEQAVTAMIQLLKHKSWDDKIGIFIISHRPEFDGRCDRNLIVRKESGFSSLIKQPD
jgi:DNA repair exonuclease SbcCD ATPase subunit